MFAGDLMRMETITNLILGLELHLRHVMWLDSESWFLLF